MPRGRLTCLSRKSRRNGAVLWQMAVLACALAFVTLVVTYSLFLGISPMPSSRRARAAVLELAPAAMEGRIFELGSGWGSLALALARRYPRHTVVALELSPVPYLVARFRRWMARRPNLQLRRENFMEADLSQASLVVCYLFRGAMARLGPKLVRELPPGAVVLSIGFTIPEWRPEDHRDLHNFLEGTVYRYTVPHEEREEEARAMAGATYTPREGDRSARD
jgi:trans-aconitate methyltransferase